MNYNDKNLNYLNFEHLEHLNEIIEIDEIPMLITHIYSNYPEYEWIEASGEGIACVDDVSRVVVLYLKYYERFQDSLYLEEVKKALNFIMYMEEDGEFYNFIFGDYSINKKGRTSKKSFDFWAIRGLRSLCYAFKVFNGIDTSYTKVLSEHIRQTFKHIDKQLKYYGEYKYYSGVKVPRWLILGGDATSEVILALLDYYEVTEDINVKNYIYELADGLVEIQIKDKNDNFYGMHFSWRNIWHAWGNTQVEALSKAGRMFKNEEWIKSARLSTDYFYPYLITNLYFNSIEVLPEGEINVSIFPQISYGIRPIVSGFIEMYKSTGDIKYAKYAGLAASWIRGNNRAGRIMYYKNKGRCYDGIDGQDRLNKNSGAESTIEALQIILEIIDNPISIKYFNYNIDSKGYKENYIIFKDSLDKKIKLSKINKEWIISE